MTRTPRDEAALQRCFPRRTLLVALFLIFAVEVPVLVDLAWRRIDPASPPCLIGNADFVPNLTIGHLSAWRADIGDKSFP